MTYGEKIVIHMRKARVGITELSKRTGISEYVLLEFLNDKRVPKAANLIVISKALGIEPTDIVGD